MPGLAGSARHKRDSPVRPWAPSRWLRAWLQPPAAAPPALPPAAPYHRLLRLQLPGGKLRQATCMGTGPRLAPTWRLSIRRGWRWGVWGAHGLLGEMGESVTGGRCMRPGHPCPTAQRMGKVEGRPLGGVVLRGGGVPPHWGSVPLGPISAPQFCAREPPGVCPAWWLHCLVRPGCPGHGGGHPWGPGPDTPRTQLLLPSAAAMARTSPTAAMRARTLQPGQDQMTVSSLPQAKHAVQGRAGQGTQGPHASSCPRAPSRCSLTLYPTIQLPPSSPNPCFQDSPALPNRGWAPQSCQDRGLEPATEAGQPGEP